MGNKYWVIQVIRKQYGDLLQYVHYVHNGFTYLCDDKNMAVAFEEYGDAGAFLHTCCNDCLISESELIPVIRTTEKAE